MLNEACHGQLGSFFRGNADNCRRNAELWSLMAEHFDAMGGIVEKIS